MSAYSEEEALQKAVKKFNVPKERITLRQDEDVLDTWFSSALFPFSIFGWPDKVIHIICSIKILIEVQLINSIISLLF